MAPGVAIVMGSRSDLPVAERAASVLKELGIGYTMTVASAHRTPDRVRQMVESSDADVFIAIAGLSAALPGAVAALTDRPVIGVPVSGKVNLDSILSIVQMPPGVPVAAVGLDRGDNAAVLAAQILALGDPALRRRLSDRRARASEEVDRHAREVETSCGAGGGASGGAGGGAGGAGGGGEA
jgi:5-(carboxyamino)imidazole ribonucleotide mutase